VITDLHQELTGMGHRPQNRGDSRPERDQGTAEHPKK
jgi:hypothetical protein